MYQWAEVTVSKEVTTDQTFPVLLSCPLDVSCSPVLPPGAGGPAPWSCHPRLPPLPGPQQQVAGAGGGAGAGGARGAGTTEAGGA